MPESGGKRGEVRDKTLRDLSRLRRREPSGNFWRSLALLGSVGWAIVLCALAGLLLGRALDARWHSGALLTAMLLTLGTSVGAWLAFRNLRRGGGR